MLSYIEKAIYLIDTQIDFVERKIHIEKSLAKCPLYKPENQVRKLKWTGSITDWVELLYALHGTRFINDGEITLKDLFQGMGEVFDFEVKTYARTFMDIKNRMKGDRTNFLDRLKNILLQIMEKADMKPSRK